MTPTLSVVGLLLAPPPPPPPVSPPPPHAATPMSAAPATATATTPRRAPRRAAGTEPLSISSSLSRPAPPHRGRPPSELRRPCRRARDGRPGSVSTSND